MRTRGILSLVWKIMQHSDFSIRKKVAWLQFSIALEDYSVKTKTTP